MINKSYLLCFALVFIMGSCKGQVSIDDTCNKKFQTARNIVSKGDATQSAMDSALLLANEVIKCNDIKMDVIDFKITLFVNMRKFKEGIKFIDSLKVDDFTFEYKKSFFSNSLKALDFRYRGDTVMQDLTYKEIATNIESYIIQQNVKGKEFKEAYTDLFSIKQQYLTAPQINREVEELKRKHPDESDFFNFFKE